MHTVFTNCELWNNPPFVLTNEQTWFLTEHAMQSKAYQYYKQYCTTSNRHNFYYNFVYEIKCTVEIKEEYYITDIDHIILHVQIIHPSIHVQMLSNVILHFSKQDTEADYNYIVLENGEKIMVPSNYPMSVLDAIQPTLPKPNLMKRLLYYLCSVNPYTYQDTQVNSITGIIKMEYQPITGVSTKVIYIQSVQL